MATGKTLGGMPVAKKKTKQAKEKVQSLLNMSKLRKDVSSGKLKFDRRAVSQPSTQADQRLVLLRQATKLDKLARRIERGIFMEENNRLAYTLLNVYQQQASVAEAIVNISDMDARVDRIIKRLIDPFAKAVATQLVELSHSLGNSLYDKFREDQIRDAKVTIAEEIRRAGGRLQLARNEVVQRVADALTDED